MGEPNYPDWIDELDELDDNDVLNLVDAALPAELTDIPKPLWDKLLARYEQAKMNMRIRTGEILPITITDKTGSTTIFAPRDHDQKISDLLHQVDGNVNAITDEQLEARGLTREEVIEKRLDIAERAKDIREASDHIRQQLGITSLPEPGWWAQPD